MILNNKTFVKFFDKYVKEKNWEALYELNLNQGGIKKEE